MNKETKKVNKTPRSEETRETKKAKQPWTPPSMLAVPNAPPPGVKYRWIRAEVLGFDDRSNVSKRFREGWEPVKAEDHPEFALTDKDERFEGNILQGGLLLCKAPEELVKERNDYYENQSRSQMHSVDNNLMRENDPRMPLFNERTTKVTNFGKGT